MFKAIIGRFPNAEAAQGAISRLREEGFPGDRMALMVRDPIGDGDIADVTLPPTGNSDVVKTTAAMGIIGLLIGGAVGFFSGGTSIKVLGGATLTMPDSTPAKTIITDALIGLIIGVVAGLLAGWLLAFGARRAEQRWQTALDRRTEALLAVATDETSVAKARKVLRDSSAVEVRRGGLSEAGAFVLQAAPVEAEHYDIPGAGISMPQATVPAVDAPKDVVTPVAEEPSPNGVPVSSSVGGPS